MAKNEGTGASRGAVSSPYAEGSSTYIPRAEGSRTKQVRETRRKSLTPGARRAARTVSQQRYHSPSTTNNNIPRKRTAKHPICPEYQQQRQQLLTSVRRRGRWGVSRRRARTRGNFGPRSFRPAGKTTPARRPSGGGGWVGGGHSRERMSYTLDHRPRPGDVSGRG